MWQESVSERVNSNREKQAWGSWKVHYLSVNKNKHVGSIIQKKPLKHPFNSHFKTTAFVNPCKVHLDVYTTLIYHLKKKNSLFSSQNLLKMLKLTTKQMALWFVKSNNSFCKQSKSQKLMMHISAASKSSTNCLINHFVWSAATTISVFV